MAHLVNSIDREFRLAAVSLNSMHHLGWCISLALKLFQKFEYIENAIIKYLRNNKMTIIYVLYYVNVINVLIIKIRTFDSVSILNLFDFFNRNIGHIP